MAGYSANSVSGTTVEKSIGDLNSKVGELTKETEEASRKVAQIEAQLASKVNFYLQFY